jgi:hypothetical protein
VPLSRVRKDKGDELPLLLVVERSNILPARDANEIRFCSHVRIGRSTEVTQPILDAGDVPLADRWAAAHHAVVELRRVGGAPDFIPPRIISLASRPRTSAMCEAMQRKPRKAPLSRTRPAAPS